MRACDASGPAICVYEAVSGGQGPGGGSGAVRRGCRSATLYGGRLVVLVPDSDALPALSLPCPLKYTTTDNLRLFCILLLLPLPSDTTAPYGLLLLIPRGL